jgi:hypothetical protein
MPPSSSPVTVCGYRLFPALFIEALLNCFVLMGDEAAHSFTSLDLASGGDVKNTCIKCLQYRSNSPALTLIGYAGTVYCYRKSYMLFWVLCECELFVLSIPYGISRT